MDITKVTPAFTSSHLRNLDIDDLYILAYLCETGNACTSVLSDALKLTDPAVSHRYRKYIRIFGEDIFTYEPLIRCRRLTAIGREKIKPCAKAFEDIFGEF